MGFTAIATKVYKDPGTVQWANSLKDNDEYLFTAAAKAWINFDGVGVISIKSSFNVGSIVDSGVGRYAINWTTDFSTAIYAVAGMPVGVGFVIAIDTATTCGTLNLRMTNNAGGDVDSTGVSVIAAGIQ